MSMPKHVIPMPRILIIDDEPMARETLEALLYCEGYELLFSTNGIDALQQMPELAPDVILLDVMMPGLDGFAVCRQLRKTPQLSHIPVILVTALDGVDALARGLEAGADEFISKPVNSVELRARVRSMLRIKMQYDALARTLHSREVLSKLIVHDMRNPLAAILLYSQLLQRRGAHTPEQASYFDLIQSEAQKLNTFLDDILLLAKMEKDELIVTRTPVDVGQLIGELKQKYAPLAASQNVDFIVIHHGATAAPVALDRHLFQRVLDNLLSAAFKRSQADSQVTLQIEYANHPHAPHLRICVIDQGPGITPEAIEHIFDKYAIGDWQPSDKTGAGLGLAFCRMVIEAHGGKIYAANNADKGAVITIEV